MKKLARLMFAAALVIGGRAIPHAVTFGEPDGNRHPYVGTIVFQTTGGYFSCSATLMNSTVLLTAGHCTEEAGQANLRTWAKFTPAISFDGRQNYPSLGDFLDDKKNGWIKGTAVAHPNYDDFAQFPLTYDVGVVVLSRGVAADTYGALPPIGFLAGIRTSQDNRFTTVGYGMQGLIKPFLEDTYARYQGQVRLLELNSMSDGGQSGKFSNNPGTGGGTCFGDSGGPVFYGTTNMVTAVVSWGITPCIGVDYQFRVDTSIAQEFLRQYIR
jgi:trypsin